MENELKPCPFCGGEAKFIEERNSNWNNESRFTARCTNPDCGARIVKMINQYDPEWSELVEGFFTRWNRRAEDGEV